MKEEYREKNSNFTAARNPMTVTICNLSVKTKMVIHILFWWKHVALFFLCFQIVCQTAAEYINCGRARERERVNV